MKTEWTYEKVSQLYNDLAIYNNEDYIIMWQKTGSRDRVYLTLPLYTMSDWEVMKKHSSCIMIITENDEAVAILWAKEEEGKRHI